MKHSQKQLWCFRAVKLIYSVFVLVLVVLTNGGCIRQVGRIYLGFIIGGNAKEIIPSGGLIYINITCKLLPHLDTQILTQIYTL